MVLVGHSMGGLIAKLQTVESADDFWKTNSDHAFAELKADPDTVRALATTYFFRPNPSVRRVVTLGTPHRGSPFSNDLTRWAGDKLIMLPRKMLESQNQLVAQNHDYFRNNAPFEIKTSIDSLSTHSPMFPPLLAAAAGTVGDVSQRRRPRPQSRLEEVHCRRRRWRRAAGQCPAR